MRALLALSLVLTVTGCDEPASAPLSVTSAPTIVQTASPTWERLRPTQDIVVSRDGGIVERFEGGAGNPCVLGCFVLASSVGQALAAERGDAGVTQAEGDGLIEDAARCMRGCP